MDSLPLLPFAPELPQVAPPTRFFPLLPLGLGTGLQESFPSYLNRLCLAHSVSPGVFLQREFARPTGGRPVNTLGFHGSRLLYNHGMAKEISAHIASLTGVSDVVRLPQPGLLPLLSMYSLARDRAAWCPHCFADWERGGKPLYFPLLWSFKLVRSCPIHRSVLRTTCAACGCKVWHWNTSFISTSCPECRTAFTADLSVPLADELEHRVSCVVHGFLDWANRTSVFPSPAVFVTNVRTACQVLGKVVTLRRQVGISKRSLGQWRQLRTRPSFLFFVKLSLVSSVPISDWLSVGMAPERLRNWSPLPDASWLGYRYPGRGLGRQRAEQILNSSLATHYEVPPSLRDLLAGSGISTASVYTMMPELARRVTARRRECLHARSLARSAQLTALVEEAIAAITSEGLTISRWRAFHYLGDRWSGSRRLFPDFYKAVRDRQLNRGQLRSLPGA